MQGCAITRIEHTHRKGRSAWSCAWDGQAGCIGGAVTRQKCQHHLSRLVDTWGWPLIQGPATDSVVLQMASTRRGGTPNEERCFTSPPAALRDGSGAISFTTLNLLPSIQTMVTYAFFFARWKGLVPLLPLALEPGCGCPAKSPPVAGVDSICEGAAAAAGGARSHSSSSFQSSSFTFPDGGLISLRLRTAFSPGQLLAHRDAPLARAREVCDRAFRKHRRPTGYPPLPYP